MGDGGQICDAGEIGGNTAQVGNHNQMGGRVGNTSQMGDGGQMGDAGEMGGVGCRSRLLLYSTQPQLIRVRVNILIFQDLDIWKHGKCSCAYNISRC